MAKYKFSTLTVRVLKIHKKVTHSLFYWVIILLTKGSENRKRDDQPMECVACPVCADHIGSNMTSQHKIL